MRKDEIWWGFYFCVGKKKYLRNLDERQNGIKVFFPLSFSIFSFTLTCDVRVDWVNNQKKTDAWEDLCDFFSKFPTLYFQLLIQINILELHHFCHIWRKEITVKSYQSSACLSWHFSPNLKKKSLRRFCKLTREKWDWNSNKHLVKGWRKTTRNNV